MTQLDRLKLDKIPLTDQSVLRLQDLKAVASIADDYFVYSKTDDQEARVAQLITERRNAVLGTVNTCANDPTTKDALREILDASLSTRAATLDLGDRQLTQLPDVFEHLWWVQSVNIADAQLATPEAMQLLSKGGVHQPKITVLGKPYSTETSADEQHAPPSSVVNPSSDGAPSSPDSDERTLNNDNDRSGHASASRRNSKATVRPSTPSTISLPEVDNLGGGLNIDFDAFGTGRSTPANSSPASNERTLNNASVSEPDAVVAQGAANVRTGAKPFFHPDVQAGYFIDAGVEIAKSEHPTGRINGVDRTEQDCYRLAAEQNASASVRAIAFYNLGTTLAPNATIEVLVNGQGRTYAQHECFQQAVNLYKEAEDKDADILATLQTAWEDAEVHHRRAQVHGVAQAQPHASVPLSMEDIAFIKELRSNPDMRLKLQQLEGIDLHAITTSGQQLASAHAVHALTAQQWHRLRNAEQVVQTMKPEQQSKLAAFADALSKTRIEEEEYSLQREGEWQHVKDILQAKQATGSQHDDIVAQGQLLYDGLYKMWSDLLIDTLKIRTGVVGQGNLSAAGKKVDFAANAFLRSQFLATRLP